MLTYKELKTAYNEWLVKKGIIDKEHVAIFGEQELPETSGDGTENGITYFSKEHKLPNGKFETFSWIEYGEDVYDEDGEIIDYKIIGYEEN